MDTTTKKFLKSFLSQSFFSGFLCVESIHPSTTKEERERERKKMKGFTILAAVTKNGGIGFHHPRLYPLPSDLQAFRARTVGGGHNAVIMGRNTWNSLPPSSCPLPNRLNVVVSSHRSASSNSQLPSMLNSSRMSWHSSMESAVDYTLSRPKIDDIYVIGGASLYASALRHSQCRRILLTRIHASKAADRYFPTIPANEYRLSYQHPTRSTVTRQGETIQLSEEVYERIMDPQTPPHGEQSYLNLLHKVMDH